MPKTTMLETLLLRQITALALMQHSVRDFYLLTGNPKTSGTLRQRLHEIKELLEKRATLLRHVRATTAPPEPSQAEHGRIERCERLLASYRQDKLTSAEAMDGIATVISLITRTAPNLG